MKKIICALLCLILITHNAFAVSLSGDNWKDPLRTKTWTPPNVSGTFVLESANQTLINKTIDGAFNTITNVPVDFDAGVTGQLPLANGNNFVKTSTNQTISGEKEFTEQVNVTGNFRLGGLVGILRSTAFGVITDAVDLFYDVTGYLPWFRGGNGNILKNASFELTPLTANYSCSVPTARNATYFVDGEYSFSLVTSSANQGCNQYFGVPLGRVGLLMEYSAYVKSNQDVELCSIVLGAVSRCVTHVANSSDTLVKISVFDTPMSISGAENGIVFRSRVATATQSYWDKLYVGDIQGGTIIDTTKPITGWSAPTAITITSTGTSPTKGTIIQDTVRWKRDGDDYLVEYRFQQSTAGGAGTGDYIVALPSGVEIDPSVFNASLGTYSSSLGKGVMALESPIAFPVDLFPYYVQGATTSFRVRASDSQTVSWVWSSGSGSMSRPQAWTLNLRFKGRNIAPTIGMAGTACQFSNSVCARSLTFHYGGGTTAVDQFGVIYPVTKTDTNNSLKAINVTSLGLINPLSCVSSINSTTGNGMASVQTVTNVSVGVRTLQQAGNHADYSFSVDCKKQLADIKTGNFNIAVIPKVVLSSDEVEAGVDFIDNGRTIYQQCFNNTFSNGDNIKTDVRKLVDVFGSVGWGASEQVTPNYSTSTADVYRIRFTQGTGIISQQKIGAGVQTSGYFCLQYTKN